MVGGTIGSLRKELYTTLLAKPADEQEAAAKGEFPSKPWNPPPDPPPLGRRRGMYAPRRTQQQQQEAAARAVEAQKEADAAAAIAAAAGTAATVGDAAEVSTPNNNGVAGADNKGGGDVEGAHEDDVRSTSPVDAAAGAPVAQAHSPAAALASPVTRRQQQQQQQQQQQVEQQQRHSPGEAEPMPFSEAVAPPPPVLSPVPPPLPPVMAPPPLSHMRVNAALHALYIVLATAASPAGLAATRAGDGGDPYAGTLDGASLLALAVHTPQAQNAPGGCLDVATLEAVLRAAANRLVGSIIIRAVEDHRSAGQYRFSVHDVGLPAVDEPGDGGGGGAVHTSGAITPPSAASPAPAACQEASVEMQREHDEAEAADALLGVAGPLIGEHAPSGGLLPDDAGGVRGLKRPHGMLATYWHPGDAEGTPKVGRASRGGRGGGPGRGGRSSVPLPVGEHPGRHVPPAQAMPTPLVGGSGAAWDGHALSAQLAQLRADVWHTSRELSGQLVSLRDEVRAQTDAVLHCLERLCTEFFSAGGVAPRLAPTYETPILPTTAPADELTALRTEVHKLRAMVVPVEGQPSPLGVPTPEAVPASGEAPDLSVDRATAADRLARSVHLPLMRPALLPPQQLWSPFALPARASPAVDAAGVTRAVAVAAGAGPLLPTRPAAGHNPSEEDPGPPPSG